MKISNFTKYAIASVLAANAVVGTAMPVFADEPATYETTSDKDTNIDTSLPSKHEDAESTKEFFKADKNGKIKFDVAITTQKMQDGVLKTITLTKETYTLDANFRDALEGYEADDPFYAIAQVASLPDGYKLQKYDRYVILGDGVTTDNESRNTIYYSAVPEDETVENQKSHYYFHDKNDNQLSSVWIEYKPGMSNESTWRLLKDNCPKGSDIDDYYVSSIHADSEHPDDAYTILKQKETSTATPSKDDSKKDDSTDTPSKGDNDNAGTITPDSPSKDDDSNKDNQNAASNYKMTVIYLDRDGNEVGRKSYEYSKDGYNEDTYTFKKDDTYKVELPDGYALDDDQTAPDTVEVQKDVEKEITLRVHKMSAQEQAAAAAESATDQPDTGVKANAASAMLGITAAGAGIAAMLADYRKRK